MGKTTHFQQQDGSLLAQLLCHHSSGTHVVNVIIAYPPFLHLLILVANGNQRPKFGRREAASCSGIQPLDSRAVAKEQLQQSHQQALCEPQFNHFAGHKQPIACQLDSPAAEDAQARNAGHFSHNFLFF